MLSDNSKCKLIIDKSSDDPLQSPLLDCYINSSSSSIGDDCDDDTNTSNTTSNKIGRLGDPIIEELVVVLNDFENEIGRSSSYFNEKESLIHDLIDDVFDLTIDDADIDTVADMLSNHSTCYTRACVAAEAITNRSSVSDTAASYASLSSSERYINSYVLYPKADMNSASVVNLGCSGDGNKKDSFISLLMETYRSTYRANGGGKLKLSLLTSNDCGAAQTLEFTNESDYWLFIAAIRRSSCGEDIYYLCKCQLTDIKSTIMTSIFSNTVVVNHHMLLINDSMGNQMFNIEIDVLQAIAVNVDYPVVKPGILHIELLPLTISPQVLLTDYRLCLINIDGKAVNQLSSVNHQQSALHLPMTLEDARSGKLLDCVQKVGIVSGTRYTGLASLEREEYIPIDRFIDYNKGDSVELMLGHRVVTEIFLKEPKASQAARILIKHATGLKANNAKVAHPSAYCTTYLLNQKGGKVLANSFDTKTSVVTSCSSPFWEKEILLQDRNNCTDSVSAVLIRVRDASSGFLQQNHIGQVTVPIDCFIFQTEAEFTLPLEPTYRMKSSNEYLGEITFTTQLVNVEFIMDSSGSRLSNHSIDGSGSCDDITDFRESNSNSTGIGTVTVTGTGTTGTGTTGTGTTGTTGTTGAGAFARITSLFRPRSNAFVTTSTNIDASDANSVSVNGNNSLPVTTSTASTTVVTTATTIVTPHSRLRRVSLSSSSPNRVAKLSYLLRKVHPFQTFWPVRALQGDASTGHILVSKTCLVIKLEPGTGGMLSNCEECRSGIVKLLWSQMKYHTVITDAVLLLSVNVRQCTSNPSQIAKNELKYTITTLDLLVAPCPSQLLHSILHDRMNLWGIRNQLKVMTSLVSFFPANYQSLGAASGSPVRTKRSLSIDESNGGKVLTLARNISNLLEDTIIDRYNDNTYTSIAESSSNSNRNESHAMSMYAKYRSRLYFAYLLDVCRQLTDMPAYSKPAVLQLVQGRVVDSQTQHSFHGDDDQCNQIQFRYNHMFKCAVADIRDYVLCSYDKVYSDVAVTKDVIYELIKCYYHELKSLLYPFISDEGSFKRIKGHSMRMFLVTMLIDSNDRYAQAMLKVLTVRGWKLEPLCSLHLLQKSDTENVIDWYSSMLVHETKTWLSKTVQNASIFKLNEFNITWDFECMADGLVISQLPEALQMQLNVYMNGIYKTNGIDSDSDGDIGNDYVKTVEKVSFHKRLKDNVLNAVYQSLVLLSVEYRRALQTKHWERGSSNDGELHANTLFILSIVNDIHRIRTVHVPSIPTSSYVSVVLNAYVSVAEIAVRHLIRILFLEVRTSLIAFDQLWVNSSSNALTKMLAALHRFYSEYSHRTNHTHFNRLIICSADTILLRYCLFLKERSLRSARFSEAEVVRVKGDMDEISSFFCKQLVSADTDTGRGNSSGRTTDMTVLASRLAYLEMLVVLLTHDFESESYLAMLHDYVCKYIHQGVYMHVGANAICHMLSIRHDTDDSMVSIARSVVESVSSGISTSSSTTSSSGAIDEDDLWARVFNEPYEDSDSQRRGSMRAVTGEGSSAFKYLREKASDYIDKTHRRKSDEHAVYIMRSLGLDDADAASKTSTGGGGLASIDDDDDAISIISAASEVRLTDEADICTVKITDIKAKNLLSSSMFGSANPYVAISYGSQRQKTSVLWGGNTCEWKKEALVFRASKSRLASYKLCVRVYDKERLRRKRLLGAIDISIAGLDIRMLDSWYALESSTSGGNGDIHMRIQMMDNTNLTTFNAF